MNHVEKYYWIINHEKIGVPYAQGTIELSPHLVNPETCAIDLKDPSKNTKSEWWVEFSKLDSEEDEGHTHYWDLDCGGDTAEEAIDTLYGLVKAIYGDY
ncbi:hypothetical protein NVP1121O_252 [Vibrio phage 1.121.O._10N.286.46.C4]|nr:hypothetical protein NVP1121O_252 [Vibrio phage 1.121.O._10N.286.46.C4]